MHGYSKVLCYKTKSLIKLKMTLKISMKLKPHKVFFLIVAVKTSKRKQPKTVYLTVKLNVIIPKSSTPYK